MSAGKGDDARPMVVDIKTFSDNWDQTFKKTEDKIYEKQITSERNQDSSRES